MALFTEIPANLPPPWWLLAAMLAVFALTVRRIFRLQDENNQTFRSSIDKLIAHFVESSKQNVKAFERSLRSVLATHHDGLAGVAQQLSHVTDAVGGLSKAISDHGGKLDVIHQDVVKKRGEP